MKTFDEALAGVMISGSLHNLEQQIRAVSVIEENTARYREIIDEAKHSAVVEQGIAGLLAGVSSGQLTVEVAMLSLFVCGLVCGIEMERTTCNEETS